MKKLPTRKEKERFCRLFNASDWAMLCQNCDFLDAFKQDLGAASVIAAAVLNR